MTPRHVALITRVELVRRVRAITGDTRRLAVVTIALTFSMIPIGFAAVGVFFAGRVVADGDTVIPMMLARGVAGGVVLAITAVIGIRAITRTAFPANSDGVLTWTTHRTVVSSIVLTESLVGLGLFGGPGAVLAVAFVLGVGRPAVLGPLVVALVCTILVGVLVGLVTGFAIRNALARSRTLARYRTVIATAAFLAYFAVIVVAESATVFEPLIAVLAATPLGWYGDLALIGLDSGPDPGVVVGAIALTIAAVPGLGLLLDRLADALWYREPVEGRRARGRTSAIAPDLGFLPRQPAHVARKSWIRAYRSPVRLVYVAYPLLFVIAPLAEALRTGTVPDTLPAFLALYGAWAIGAAFTLNPIGDEGPVLPITLSSPITGTAFVGGLCTAGIAIGIPLIVPLVGLAAVFAGLSILETAGLVVLAIALTCGSVGIAAGAGVLFPRLEPVAVLRNRTAVIPSLVAFGLYSLALGLASAPGLIVTTPLARRALADVLDVDHALLVGAGVALSVAVVAVVAGLGVTLAVRTFDRYSL